MARVRVTFQLDGQPLKRTYIEHVGPFGVHLGMYITDNQGRVMDGSGTLGIDSFSSTGVDIKIHCQNTVVKVLNGGVPLIPPFDVIVDEKVDHNSTVTISTQLDHFRILQQAIDAYDTVFRQFKPFNRSSRGDFPFGRKSSLRETKNMQQRIELSYPDLLSPALAFVEPVSAATTYPLMHIKDKSNDRRLFGDSTHSPSLIPHELSHALHFATLPFATRVAVEASYLAWITGRVAAGQPPFHNTNLATLPLVAFLEALGLFSERFFFFKKRVRPNLSGVQLRQAFFREEMAVPASLANAFLGGDGYLQVARKTNGTVTPLVGTADNVEGAVYGAVFLDFASRVGLKEVVGRFFDSRAMNYDDYRNHIINNANQFQSDINAVTNTWNL